MLQGYVVNSGSHISTTANVSLSYNNNGIENVAFGIGPIEAAFHAIENIVQTGAQLLSYQIRSMSRGMDAQGQVDVELEWQGHQRRYHRGQHQGLFGRRQSDCQNGWRSMEGRGNR